MAQTSEKFWLNDISELLSCKIIPQSSMTEDERLNALTRLIMISSIVLLLLKQDWWVTFLLAGVLLVIIIKYGRKKEGYSAIASYSSPDSTQTIVSPIFAEEYQIPPPAYTLISNEPPSTPLDATEQFPIASYPYGQYLTKTNQLPQDEYMISMSGGSTNIAREYANSAFLRHRIAQQEDATRIYKKTLGRRYKNNTNDTFSPFSSY